LADGQRELANITLAHRNPHSIERVPITSRPDADDTKLPSAVHYDSLNDIFHAVSARKFLVSSILACTDVVTRYLLELKGRMHVGERELLPTQPSTIHLFCLVQVLVDLHVAKELCQSQLDGAIDLEVGRGRNDQETWELGFFLRLVLYQSQVLHSVVDHSSHAGGVYKRPLREASGFNNISAFSLGLTRDSFSGR
jgi:hypothetical protein